MKETQSKKVAHSDSGPHVAPYSDHWADIYANKIVRQKQEPFVCASGITPSGTVHIGNFREIISVELVVRALKDIGASVRFIYSWDDYDVFRKVPPNMPQQELLAQYLRQPITDVPDVLGSAESYARANEEELEAVLHRVGISPEYIYQAKKYQASDYAEGIRKALEQREVIRAQLNEHRNQPLAADWWPVSIFCGKCQRDTTTCTAWDGEWAVSYTCECQHRESVDLRHTGLVKLPWRIDWPMRWAYEGVDFEPAGKDHHSEGGSFSTAKETCKAVYDFEAPISFQYDFVRIKGLGGKISSSSGEVLSLADVLEVYPPEIIRYLFASSRPNSEFAISFDLDVLKIYDDFVRCEQAYYEGEQDAAAQEGQKSKEQTSKQDKKPNKKRAKLKRIYQLSQVAEAPTEQPFSLPLRHLCNLLQIYDGDVQALKSFLGKEGTPVPEHSAERFQTWADCAQNWLAKYAPPEFLFTLRKPGAALSKDFVPSTEFLGLLPKLRAHLQQQFQQAQESGNFDRSALSSGFYELLKDAGLESRDVFPQMYQLLIGRNEGPRLMGFLEAIQSAIGLEQLLELLRQPE